MSIRSIRAPTASTADSSPQDRADLPDVAATVRRPDEPRTLTIAELAAIFLPSAVLWWRLFSLLISVLGRTLSRKRVRKAFDRVTGTVLMRFGIAMVLENR